MRDIRVYQEQNLTTGDRCQLSGGAAHHVAKVLRMQAGQSLILFNGRGGYYDAIIEAAGKHGVTVTVGGHHAEERESPLRITLVQGISRGQRMDYTLQKAVELGVQHIVPLWCEHSSVRLDPEQREKRHAHWSGIIINACEQCGRNRLPELSPPLALDQWTAVDTNPLKLILHPGNTRRLGQLGDSVPEAITLLAGPEGGFSQTEIIHAEQQGYQSISLGPRILRTETAALVAIAACQVLWGDIR